MSNFKADILETVEDDTIEAVVIISNIYSWTEPDPRNILTASHLGKRIFYELALTLLDYEYSSDYGAMDCHDILMYSKDWVYYIHEYDGSTSIDTLPRNPPI